MPVTRPGVFLCRIKMQNRRVEMLIIDAFSSKAFSGNPAGVCLVEQENVFDNDEKQNIAAEMNLAETAFLHLLKPGDTFDKAKEFKLQWFTPVMEVNLCGHATMASSAALFHVKGNQNDALIFHTKSGELIARRRGSSIAINLPLNPCTTELPSGCDEIVKMAVGSITPLDVQYAPGANSEILIRLPDIVTRKEFETIQPDLYGLMTVYNFKGAPGVILTVKGKKDTGSEDENGRPFDFLSRYFDPWNGIPEDPVTGAAHCVLAAYWSKVLEQNQFYARQCSPRGGNLEIQILGEDRVELSGTAVVMYEGHLTI